ncbi:MAG: hypothetical protein WD207_00440 [Xanthobacteraceae bacterium]
MKVILVVLLGLLSAACTRSPAQPVAAANPADPEAAVPAAARYRSSLGTYVSQRPVEPAPWQEQNERVAPRPKQ